MSDMLNSKTRELREKNEISNSELETQGREEMNLMLSDTLNSELGTRLSDTLSL